MKRVVITGVGPVSSLGTGWDGMRKALREGRSAITAQPLEFPDGTRSVPTGAIPDFSVTPFLKSRKAYLDRTSKFALAGASLALDDAGLDDPPRAVGDIGLLLGTMYGCVATSALYYGDVIDKGTQAAKPVLFPHLYANSAASLTAIEFNLGGMHAVTAGGWTAGAEALLQAADWIAGGRAATLLAGGVDALHPLIVRGLQAENRLSPLAGEAGGSEGVYSFDPRANGIVPGEGAGILALESEEHAVARGGRVHALLRGGARGAVASAEAAAAVMVRALERSACSCSELSWVCAHGAGDPVLDSWEGGALSVLAGKRERPLPVWTPAPFLGETFAAGTVFRAVLAIGIMRDGRLPALPGGLTCKPDFHGIEFRCESRAVPPGPVMINTFCPGGSLVSIVVEAI